VRQGGRRVRFNAEFRRASEEMNAVLNQFTIKARIRAAFAIMLILVIGVGLLGINRLAAVNARAADIRDNWLPSTAVQGRLLSAVQDFRVQEARYGMAQDAAERREVAEQLSGSRAAVDRLRAEYEPLITRGTDDERFMHDFDAAWRNHLAMAQTYLAPDAAKPRDLFLEANRRSFLDATEALQNDLALNVAEGKKAADAGEAVYKLTRLVVMAVLAGSVIVGLLLALTITRSVSAPITRITSVMKRLADHDLAVSVDGTERRDEIGAMAVAVLVFRDSMAQADRLAAEQAAAREAREVHAARLAELVRGFERQIGLLVGHLSSAATELEATARTMNGAAEQTAGEAASAAQAASDANVGVQTVAAAAEELAASIGEINRQVVQSTAVTGQAVAEARRTDTIVHDLSAGAQKIGDVVKLIASIAGQTNLLALNATIEAARAGEAGKGFAVVASEVKGLASQTAKATDEIAEQVNRIQSTTQEAVTAIRAISGMIETVSGIATSIASAVEEQGAATAEIARNVQQTSASTQQVTARISGVSASVGSTGAAASQVLGAAGELSAQAERLTQEVGGFIAAVQAA
jgi:methyl-accepting chemotaxis protein